MGIGEAEVAPSAAPASAAGAARTAEALPGAMPADDPHAYRREVFWNLPNTITVLRIAVVPVMILLVFPFAQGPGMSLFLGWCYIVAALSDILDGYLARRGAQVTRIGKLLDPLADKLLVSTALIVLVSVGRIPAWAVWMVVVIVGRELAVTGLRGIASSHGQVVAASWQGKMKTFAQNISAVALLFHYPVYGLPSHEIGLTLLAVATALTLWSGYVYFADYFGWGEPEKS